VAGLTEKSLRAGAELGTEATLGELLFRADKVIDY
jgi:hypothetical protein